LDTATALECRLGEDAGWVVRVTGIDRRAGTADLSEDGTAAKPSTLLATESGLTFVTLATAGSLIFTTVFAGPPEETEYYAVQSRHMTVMTGIPQLGQQAGVCTLHP